MLLGYEARHTCDHQGALDFATVAGYGVRYCTGCGLSWVMWMCKGGVLAWVPIEELDQTVEGSLAGEEEHGQMGDLVETVSGVRDGEGDR